MSSFTSSGEKVISIHALREEGDGSVEGTVLREVISIHALREEGDRMTGAIFSEQLVFLSTPSARRATSFSGMVDFLLSISIHALREEGDPEQYIVPTDVLNFYPRPPRGGRLCGALSFFSISLFLSTPSARRATAKTEKNISAFVSL